MTEAPLAPDAVDEARFAALPKVELHVHLVGCVRPGTLAELSHRHGVALPLPAEALYSRTNSQPTPDEASSGPWFPLLRVYELICRCLVSPDDFARVTYEALADAYSASNVRYQELSVSPSVHLRLGVQWRDMAEGLLAGLRAAQHDFGVTGAFVAAINREDTPAAAMQMLEAVLEHDHDAVVAVGLDFDERRGPPESFADAYALARRRGLHRTAHAGEHVEGRAGAVNIVTCLELLGCERVDHGYHVLADDKVVGRCRDEGIPFDVAFTTSRRGLRPWRQESVAEMIRQGLRVNLSSDDPQLFPTTVAAEYAIARSQLGLSWAELTALVRNGVAASFMEDEERRRWGRDVDSADSEIGRR